MKKLMTLLILIALMACREEMIEPPDEPGQLKSASINKEQIIVKYKESQRKNIGQVKKQFHGLTVLRVENADHALEILANDPNVEYAEPDYWVNICVEPNDSLYPVQWGLNTKYGIDAPAQWDKGNYGSEDIYVGIIDQGYMITHPDLIGNVGINPGEIGGNNIDDDSNGYIDDVYGWDFFNDDASVFNGEVDYHGTHVAGIIGAVGNNTIGVIGVAPKVRLISGKFIGSNGGYTSDAIEAIYYMIALKAKGMNIVALNNSWGGADRSRSLQQAIDDAGEADILFVCAAGNTGGSKVPFPAGYGSKNIISVASINSVGNLSAFSTYNKRLVDIAAPGEQIMSTYYSIEATWIGGKWVFGKITYYKYLNGTSMACPHVTGAAVLYKSLHPSATWQEIKTAILNSAISTPSLTGKVLTGGRLDISRF